MKCSRALGLFVVLLVLEVVVLAIPVAGYRQYFSIMESLYISEQDGEFSALSEEEGNRLYETGGLHPRIYITLVGYGRPKPLYWMFELYEIRSIHVDLNPVYSVDGSTLEFSPEEETAIREVVIEYAQADPVLRTYNPGGEPVAVFSSERLGRTVMFWGGASAVPGAIVLGLLAMSRFSKAGRQSKLRELGRCVSCGYSLAGLADCVCPECGNQVP